MIALATSASSAPNSIGRRRPRATPCRLAITAARISTASSPSRNTITAALVTTVAVLAPSPSEPAPSSSASSSARRVSCTSRRRAALGDQLGQPVVALGAEPDEALHARHHAGRDRAQAQLGAELEEGVGLEPGLLGLGVLAGAHGALHAVERELDQVEVGLRVVLAPLLRQHPVERLAGLLVRGLHLVLVHHLAAAAGVLDVGLEPRERPLERGHALRVALGERGLEVGERGRRALAEGDRLLDLERDRHAAVVGAVAVLDRHQVEEAHELRGAARLLLGREGGGGEAVERLRHVAAGGLEGGELALAGGLLQRGEGARGLRGGRGAARPLVARREDGPEPGGLGGGLAPSAPRSRARRRPRRRSGARRARPGRRRAGPSPPRAAPCAGRAGRGRGRARPRWRPRPGA